MGFKLKNKRRIKICSVGETLNYGRKSVKFYEALKFIKQWNFIQEFYSGEKQFKIKQA